MSQLLTVVILDAYLNGLRLINAYTSIHWRAFEKAVEDREEAIEATIGGAKGAIMASRLDSVYNMWLKNSDQQLEDAL